MKITRSLVWKVARTWGRGFIRGAAVYYIAYLPWSLASDFLRPLEHHSLLYIGLASVLFVLWVVLAPLHLGVSDIDPHVTREQVKSIETRIDETATLLGINWAETYLAEVDTLLNDGLGDAARKVWHQHAGGTWDEAYFALRNWPATLLAKKLEVIQRKLKGKS